MSPVIYEPRFYERRALHHFCTSRRVRLMINHRIPEPGVSLFRQVEVDGLLVTDGRAVAIEVKSRRLDAADVAAIRAWYMDLGFGQTTIIAPEFTRAALVQERSTVGFDLVEYRPNEDAMFDWYESWRPAWPAWLADTIASGRHHFRYVLTRASEHGGRVVNQVSKRIYDAAGVVRDVLRLPHPPARVYWTPQRWTTPKDVFSRNATPLALGGLGVLDVDGTPLHAAMHACEINPESPRCDHCRRWSLAEARKALEVWPSGLPPASGIFDSGNRGLHIYFAAERRDVIDAAVSCLSRRGVRLDYGATVAQRAVVGLPGSLYGGTKAPLASVAEPC